MDIGQIIKKLRREKDITQEKFAEYLNISPQAVSRWETGTAYPDITAIPIIANFFGVSTDVNLGVDACKNEEKIQNYLKEYQYLNSLGNKKDVEILMKKAVTEYPGDFRIIVKFAWTLSASPYSQPDGECLVSEKELGDINNSVISMCQRILEDCTEDEIRYDAISLLSMTYGMIGDTENAEKVAKRLPEYYYTQNFMLGNIYNYDSDEHIIFHQKNVEYLVESLWIEIRSCSWGQKDIDEKIRLLKKGISLYELIYDDKNYGFYSGDLSAMYLAIAENYLIKGDNETALDNLANSVEHCIALDNIPTGYKHKSILVNKIVFKKENTSKGYEGTAASFMLHKLQNKTFDSIRDTERFKVIEQKLKDFYKLTESVN
jgi:Predicted transcriptional regulators